MTDLSKLSDDELLTMYQQSAPSAPTSSDLSRMSDDDLMSLYRQTQPMEAGEVARDVTKSAASGLQRGVGFAVGAPTDIWQALDKGWQWAATTAGEKLGILSPEAAEKLRQPLPGEEYRFGSESINKAIADVSGDYKPQTTVGKYAKTVGEFVPSAVSAGPMGVVKYGVLPGMASEAAGQATEGTSWEPWARAGAALLTGGGAAIASRPSNAGRIVQDAMPGITPQQLGEAQSLMAAAASRGMPLTLPEAVQQVTNGGTKLADVQRVIEGSRKGGQIMKEFYAGRPAGTDAGVRQALDAIAPPNMAPTEIAPRVQAAAAGELADTRKAINDAARPYYEAAERALPPSQDPVGLTIGARADLGPLVSDPQVQAAIKGARSHPVLGAELQAAPDDAFRVLDAAKKYADDAASAARAGGQNEAAAAWSGVAQRIRSGATQTGPDAYPSYAEALRIGREGREQVLAPLERSPTGQLAHSGQGMHGGDPFTEQARIILNPNPLPNSHGQVADAVRAVAARDPQAARDLVRTHLEQVFNETTQRLVSGENQWGGAKYAAVLAGNPQQAKNLEAALLALPRGMEAYSGFRKTLDVLEAQGRRQPIGSQTEFNRLLSEDLGKGGKGEIGALLMSPTALGRFVSRAYADLRYGKNTETLARLFTSPDGIAQASKLSGLDPTSIQAQGIVARMLIGANTGARSDSGRNPPQLPPPQR